MQFLPDSYMVLLAFFISLFVCFRPGTPSYFHLFPLFLLATFLVEGVGIYRGAHDLNNMVLYNIFGSVEYVFYFYVLSHVVQNNRVKSILFCCLFIFPILVIINLGLLQPIRRWSSLTHAIGSFLVVFFCIYYFLELYRSDVKTNFLRESPFWICTGLLFFYACSFPLVVSISLMHELPVFIQVNINRLLIFLNFILYGSFAIAFLCRIQIVTSTSQP